MFLSNGQVIGGAAVSTLGDQTPVVADASYYGTQGLPLLNTFAAYAAIYKTQLWVGTVVRKLAMATARMPFEVKKRVNDTDSVNERGNLSELLARPNPHMSGFTLWEWTSSTRDVYGEAFWLKLRDNRGRVRELHPMHPNNIIVRLQADGSIGYVYSNGRVNSTDMPVIPEADVVAFTTYNPENLLRGLSTLEALRMTLLNEDAARRATAAMWAKGARPAMILTTQQSLSQGAQDRLKAQFDRAHAGADNTGSTAVFEEGLTATKVQLSAEEMQYIDSRKLNREEVCAAFDVPPPVVHILDHATFSNITEQLRSQYRDTMAPRFVNFESVIDHQLVPDFYPDRDVFTRFNMEEVLRGDFETKATATVSMRNAGFLTGNEARGLFGLPRSEDAQMDRVYANSALAPLGAGNQPADGDQTVPLDRGELVATTAPSTPADVPKPATSQDSTSVVAPSTVAVPVVTPNDIIGARVPSARAFMGRLGRAKQAGSTVKTWVVDDDCIAHAMLRGLTVPIDDVFPNGSRVPGDGATPDAGCSCDLTFSQESS